MQCVLPASRHLCPADSATVQQTGRPKSPKPPTARDYFTLATVGFNIRISLADYTLGDRHRRSRVKPMC